MRKRTIQASRVTFTGFAKGGRAALGEMGFDFIVRDSWARIVQCFLHLRAEPGVMYRRVGRKGERQRTLVGNARQQDTHGIRDGQSHVVEHRSRTLFQRGVDARLHQCLLIERTQAGLARARAEGKTMGRPSALTVAQQAEARRRLEQGESVSQLARDYNTTRQTIMRVREGSASA